MKTKSRLFTAASVVAVASTAASPVLAAGTRQGTEITNNVTVSYQVNGVDQTAAAASDKFVVDRKVMLAVSETGNGATSITPGASDPYVSFTLSNSSNDTLDFALTASNSGNGAGKNTGVTDNFDLSTTFRYYRESNNVAGPQAEELVTSIDDLASDTNVTIHVVAVGQVPLARANGDASTISLTATALSATGAALVNTTGANTAGVDTVFADAAANGDAANNGQASDRDDFRVAAAALTAAKSSRLLWDPVNGAANPKMIPGAVLEYCIAVRNAAGAATATNVNLSDILPVQTRFLTDGTVASGSGVAENTGIGIRVGATGSVTGSGPTLAATCQNDGTLGGTYTAGPPATVAGTLPDVAGSETRALRFRVVVN